MPNVTNLDYVLSSVLWIRTGFIADPDPDYISMRIRIQGAKPMGIHANPDPDPDPGHTFKSQKSEFLHEKYT